MDLPPKKIKKIKKEHNLNNSENDYTFDGDFRHCKIFRPARDKLIKGTGPVCPLKTSGGNDVVTAGRAGNSCCKTVKSECYFYQ